jgi:hypothetical protein
VCEQQHALRVATACLTCPRGIRTHVELGMCPAEQMVRLLRSAPVTLQMPPPQAAAAATEGRLCTPLKPL